VYTGSASGFRGTTQVQVTVSGGVITDITVLSTGDDAEFFNRAKSTVISEIIAAQGVSVDTVSGATFSSNGIIGAVSDALSGASAASASQTTASAGETAAAASSAGTAEAEDTEEDTETTAASTTLDSTGLADLADGTYTGSGTGFRGETVVSVTVKNGQITSVTVTSYSDDEKYFSRAETQVISEIIANQTASVDAVSGATFSSNGIMEAVADALGLEYTATTPTGGNHGGPGGRH